MTSRVIAEALANLFMNCSCDRAERPGRIGPPPPSDRRGPPQEEPAMPVPPIPPGYRSVTPYLAIDGAARAIAFYVEVFGAKERMRLEMPGGRIGHAEIEIGDSVVMLADPWPEGSFLAPAGGDAPAHTMVHLYLEDADATFAKALAAGATVLQPMETKFYGDRSGCVRDPFGHRWNLATHVEDVPEEEMARRFREMTGG
jgi:PhnB protein